MTARKTTMATSMITDLFGDTAAPMTAQEQRAAAEIKGEIAAAEQSIVDEMGSLRWWAVDGAITSEQVQAANEACAPFIFCHKDMQKRLNLLAGGPQATLRIDEHLLSLGLVEMGVSYCTYAAGTMPMVAD